MVLRQDDVDISLVNLIAHLFIPPRFFIIRQNLPRRKGTKQKNPALFWRDSFSDRFLPHALELLMYASCSGVSLSMVSPRAASLAQPIWSSISAGMS